jgi:hypothetical protein
MVREKKPGWSGTLAPEPITADFDEALATQAVLDAFKDTNSTSKAIYDAVDKSDKVWSVTYGTVEDAKKINPDFDPTRASAFSYSEDGRLETFILSSSGSVTGIADPVLLKTLATELFNTNNLRKDVI